MEITGGPRSFLPRWAESAARGEGWRGWSPFQVKSLYTKWRVHAPWTKTSRAKGNASEDGSKTKANCALENDDLTSWHPLMNTSQAMFSRFPCVAKCFANRHVTLMVVCNSLNNIYRHLSMVHRRVKSVGRLLLHQCGIPEPPAIPPPNLRINLEIASATSGSSLYFAIFPGFVKISWNAAII